MDSESSDQKASRNIPESVKRAVRQRCGFGCVVCGIPFYHYDHIQEFAEVGEHAAGNITLLCARHHDEKTRGALPTEAVINANATPRSVTDGVTAPYRLHYGGGEFLGIIGSNVFVSPRAPTGDVSLLPLVVDGVPIIMADTHDGEVFLSLRLFDAFNFPWLIVDHNELQFSTGAEDVSFKGMRNAGGSELVIKDPENGVFLQARFGVPDSLTIVQAQVFCNGVRVAISPDGALSINGQSPGGATFIGSRFERSVGIVIGPNGPPKAAMRFARVARSTPSN